MKNSRCRKARGGVGENHSETSREDEMIGSWPRLVQVTRVDPKS